ncbi:MAG: SAM-dependent methyltransferase [Clostridiales bacterium]|nr:SAM-dependent methyltransferase [Clostridiales bacterium]
MNSERIKALASEISKEDIVLDVGSDHGYLCVYLKQNNLCKDVYASDISEKALNSARKNFGTYNLNIKSYVSDGFSNIPVLFNTAVIAGMGTSTILHILEHEKKPEKLVISSHNEHYKLRKELNKLGYIIVNEKAILENKHYYIILTLKKGNQKLRLKEMKYGISNNKNYYKYLLSKNKSIIKKVPLMKKIKLCYENLILKGLIGKK